MRRSKRKAGAGTNLLLPERSDVARLVKLLVRGSKSDEWARSQRAIEDVRFYLELARRSYDDAMRESETEPRTADLKTLRAAVAATRRLRTALNKPGLKERVAGANQPRNEDADELEQYAQAYTSLHKYADFERRLTDLERMLLVAERALPKSTPDRALRCAVAPLLALFREHNPGAKFWRGGSGESRAVRFVVEALRLTGIDAAPDTIGRFTPEELPFIDW